MIYHSSEKRADYTMPLLGNGELCIRVSHKGTMDKLTSVAEKYCLPTNYIWWAGRRYVDFFGKSLVPFGRFSEIFDDTDDWTQELDTYNAKVTSVCNFPFGQVTSTNFIHHDYNLVAVKKIFEIDEEKEYTFCYTLDDCKCQSLYDRRVDLSFETTQNGMTVDYCVDGYKMYKGRIHVFSDKLCSCMLENNTIILHTTVRPAEEICFYIILEDDFQSENYTKRADDIKKMVLTQGFEGMYVTHREKWNSYMNEGYVQIPDEKLDNAYRTAQYSIKAQTTEWSIPVALCDAAWNARYFAFDEYFCCYALLSSNHKNLARRVPEFRNKGLDIAVTRATCGSPFKEKQARYPWETLEDGVEASTPGEWYDHIFHMSHIIMGTCEYYFYTRDRGFLEKCYNMVVCCSGFLMDHMVYTLEGGKTVIGKCCDLERMGPARENAYMTTCSVIRALQYTAEVSNIVGDIEYAERAKDIAEKLKVNLPHNGHSYVPFPGAEISSIALFTGSYPYSVVSSDDDLQKNAFFEFESRENEFGNCYVMGNGVSTWYASMKAASYARTKRLDDVMRTLAQAMTTVGCFAEIYEINEPYKVAYNPWFTTAGGVLISAVNDALLQKEGNNIYLLPAYRGEGVIRFKLAASDNTVVEAEFVDNYPTYLNISSDIKELNIIMPDGQEQVYYC